MHSRWEGELFERNRAALQRCAGSAESRSPTRATFMFDVLLASNRLAAGVLAADRKAAAGREFYDDGYFEAFAREQLAVWSGG